MFLIDTNFQHKKIHSGTWISPDHQTLNQIDHIMVSKRKMRLIHDVRLKRGHNCNSDHFLVQIKIKQKLITVKNRQTQKYKWDRWLLIQNKKINKYQKHLQSVLQEKKRKQILTKTGRILNRWYLRLQQNSNQIKVQGMLTTGGMMNVKEPSKKRTKQEENV